MTTTVMLADDHQIVRQGLRAILNAVPEFQLVGEASDGLEAVRLAERLRPDVLVLDLSMPGLDGLEVARQVTKRPPRPRVVVLSMYSDEAYVHKALQAGATAYVLKDAGAEQLVQAIRAAARGQRYFSPPLTADDVEAYLRRVENPAEDPKDALTSREREVLHLTVEGHSGTDIAERLFISPRTVETHRANLMRKLGVRNQKELVRFAIERGLMLKEP
jgi:two-component system, NarL family, response regulator NreC